MAYQVLWVADEHHHRGYRDRQLFANERGAAFYLEVHFNAKKNDRPGMDDNPASVLVADNASRTSRGVARDMAVLTSKTWNFPSVPGSVVELTRGSRGYYNLFYTRMPAVLTELFWVSEVEHVAILNDPAEMRRLAELLCNVIRKWFPKGGLIALSVGHLFKGTGDQGAPVAGEDGEWEAQLALKLCKLVEELLTEEKDGCHCPHCGKPLTVS